MSNLIYLSPIPWVSFAQRPHKFVSWFREKYGGRVLWIEPYATRLPRVADLQRVGGNQSLPTAAFTPDWLTVISPASLPIEPIPGSGMVNRVLWRKILTQAVQFEQGAGTVLVIGKPSILAIQLMKALPQCRSVYDAMDDFPAFYSGFSKSAMKRTEENIVVLADEIWASSTHLLERWSNKHNNVRLIYNGLDADVVKLSGSMPATADQMIFGYLGTVGNWFDWELIFALSKIVPNDIIRIIGPIYKPAPKPLPKNIETLPPCAHSEAMIAMAKFDVGLIPFLQNELTRSVDPIKYYEYRALGMPVISSSFGEMCYRDETDGVYLVSDTAVLKNTVLCARKEVKPKRLDTSFINENSWTSRFDHTSL